ncbi:MAG TPA: phage portal protein [Mycobacteriales bacterium]
MISKALTAVALSVEAEGHLSKAFLSGNAAQMPGSSFSSQGSSTRLIQRVTQNLASSFKRAPEDLEAALARQGLSWGPPFPPGRPLDPFWGYKRPPRTWDYSVGENVQLTPRWDRVSFATLKALYDSYDVAQVCVRHLINDVRSLEYQFVPPMNVQEDATSDVERAETFFRRPDRRQPFRAWLAEYLQDVLRYDAGCLFVQRTEKGEPYALEVVSGPTMIPLIDFFGRVAMDEPPSDEVTAKIAEAGGSWSGETVPAYLQIIEGMPWVWLTGSEVIYQPWNPLPDSQYGLAPLEAVMLTANTDIRFQWHFLQYFTAGTIPAGFMEAPPDLSDPSQVREWQDTWDAVMMGDQEKLRQIRWVPAGAKFTALKPSADAFDSAFPLYLMRRVAAAFGVTPNDLGFTEDVNRSCYSEDTEVLTEHGWKRYWEVARTERIATVNPESRAIEYHVPYSLHTYPYEGEMVHFSSRNVDVLVTPDHKMWAGRTRTGTRLPVWEKVEAERLDTGSWFRFAATAGWSGHDIDSFTLPAVESQSHKKPERRIAMDLWLEFLGYVVSEGCVYRAKQVPNQRNRCVVTLSQSERVNPEKTRVIGACLARLPFAFASYVDADGTRRWQVSDKALWTWLSQHVGHLSGDKHLPAFVHTLGKRQLDILLEALMLGDGTTDRRDGNTGRTYYTKSARLAGEAQEVAWKLGYRAQIGYGAGVHRVLLSGGPDFQLGRRNISREVYRGTVWCFHVENHLFVTRRNGKIGVHGNTGDTQVDVQFRVGTLPLIRHVEDVINTFIAEQLKLKAVIQFDVGREVEDRLQTAQAEQIYIQAGVLSPDEVRQRLGKRTSRDRPAPRIMDNGRAGPIPLLAIESLAGDVDPTTFGPAKDQPLIDHPFVSAPGAAPVVGSAGHKQSQNATSAMQDNMLIQNADPRSSQQVVRADGNVDDEPQSPEPPSDAEKALEDAMAIIGMLLEKDNAGGPGLHPHSVGWDNTGGPGVHEAPQNDDDEIARIIANWKSNSKRRVRKGALPRRFDGLPDEIADGIWSRLEGADTPEAVDAAFA